MDTYTFKTDLTLEDYKGLCWMQAFKAVIVIAAAGGIFVYLMLMRILTQPALLAAIAAASAVVIFFAMRFYVNMRANKIYRMSNVSAELILRLNDTGIIQQSNAGETELLWEDVFRVAENKACYFVFLSRNKAFYFPKRNFKSADDEKAFIDYVVDHVSPLKIKFKR